MIFGSVTDRNWSHLTACPVILVWVGYLSHSRVCHEDVAGSTSSHHVDLSYALPSLGWNWAGADRPQLFSAKFASVFRFCVASLWDWEDPECRPGEAQGSVVSNWIGMKFSMVVLQVNTHRLMESDFQFDATLSRCWPLRHFTQKSAAIWWMHTAQAFAWRKCSNDRQLLIHISC